MSQENVERYRRSVHTWNRGALDEWLEDITPQWECVLSGTFPGLAPIYRGREGALAWWKAAREPWEEGRFHFEIERIEELEETLLGLGTLRAKGKESGVDVALKWAHVVTYYGGQQQIRHYPSWEEALEAVGLSE
jgi:ketosteroid isomerase-like protein